MPQTKIDQAGLVDRLRRLQATRRQVIAIAGAPGSGKSTLAEAVVDDLNADAPGKAALLPMDGYHYDDGLLTQMGRLPYKGAADTFDVVGLAFILERLAANTEPVITDPVFDRDLEIARAGARQIPQSVEILIVEGNYILLQEDPWARLAPFFDLTVRIDVPEDELRRRLTQRWVGYDLDEAAIAHKLDGNDLPNGRVVRERSAPADFLLIQD